MILDDNDSWLVGPVVSAIRDTLKLAEAPSEYLRDIATLSQDSNNPTRRIDLYAQQSLKSKLKILFEGNICFIAEEPDPHDARVPDDLKKSAVTVAILDPIDGTDLWVRGFGNWCISVAFFDPRQLHIRAAFVGYSSGDIYWATRHSVCRRDEEDLDHSLAISRPEGLALRDAAICFYGQKAANFYAVHKNAPLLTWLRDNRAKKINGQAPRFRIYNLAGNPMMVRMTESNSTPAAIDAVFELKGQKVYDVIPGAFIAKRAGATFVDLANRPIDLDRALRERKVLKYVLAATPGLAKELVSVLNYPAKEEPK